MNRVMPVPPNTCTYDNPRHVAVQIIDNKVDELRFEVAFNKIGGAVGMALMPTDQFCFGALPVVIGLYFALVGLTESTED